MLAGVLAALCLSGCSGQTQAGEETQLSHGETGQEQTQRTDYADTALVGNSYIDSFYTYDAMPGASYYYRVGLNVNSVFDQPMLLGEDTETPVIERLQEQDFAHIIFSSGKTSLAGATGQHLRRNMPRRSRRRVRIVRMLPSIFRPFLRCRTKRLRKRG